MHLNYNCSNSVLLAPTGFPPQNVIAKFMPTLLAGIEVGSKGGNSSGTVNVIKTPSRDDIDPRGTICFVLLNGHVVKLLSECLFFYVYICATLSFGQRNFLLQWSLVNAEIHNNSK